MITEENDWTENYISADVSTGEWIAWDETQSHELGRFYQYADAKKCLIDYAVWLELEYE